MQPTNRKNVWLSVLLGLVVLFGLYQIKQYSYLLFHCLVELFSIVVAFGIFALAWNVRRLLDNTYLLFIGIAYLFVGILDLVHTLAYTGMQVFEESGPNLATQLWVAARYVESLSLLLAPAFLGRKLRPNFAVLAYALLTSVLLSMIFSWRVFPICFVEGEGLTPFKKYSEYVISLTLCASIVLLARRRREFDGAVLTMLIASIALTVGSELAFALYRDPYGRANMIGHFFKIISFYLVYKAIIETGLTRPYDVLYRNLKESEQALRGERDFTAAVLSTADALVVVLDREGRIVRFNRKCEDLTGYKYEEVERKPFWDLFLIPEEIEPVKGVFARLRAGQFPIEYENYWVTKDGRHRLITWANAALSDAEGTVEFVVATGIDVTEKRRAELALRESEQTARALLNAPPEVVALLGTDGTVLDANETTARRMNLPLSDLVGSIIWNHFAPEVANNRKAHVEAAIQSKQPVRFEDEYDGRWNDNIIYPVFDAGGDVTKVAVFAHNITEYKWAEETIKRSLVEKSTLLRELYHRVKNNLQVVSSLLRLQSAAVDAPEAKAVLQDSQIRIQSMAKVHEMLYQSRDLAKIDFKAYLKDMGTAILHSHGGHNPGVMLEVVGEKILLDVSKGIPCGLAVSEILTNALKHAFPDGRKGKVEVALRHVDHGQVEMIVRDDGVGIAANIDTERNDSLGLKLLTTLVRDQLRGEVSVDRTAGTEFRIRFPNPRK